MNQDRANTLLKRLNQDRVIQNFIAQADSRGILLSVNEPKANFPKFTISDFRLNLLAMQYLAIGCSFAENGQVDPSISPLEQAGNLLTQVNYYPLNQSTTSNYYLLCSALSFYASFQYSKAFIILKNTEYSTPLAQMVSGFLKKDYEGLLPLINEYLIADDYLEENLIKLEPDTAEDQIILIVFARALNSVLFYFYKGGDKYLVIALEQLDHLLEFSSQDHDPGLWWVIRIFRLIVAGLNDSVIRNNINPLIDPIDRGMIELYVRSLAFRAPGPIVELFLSQRRVLQKVLDRERKGVIISLPTSSGKTRVAELAILKCLTENPGAKILYLAPFRSLAFEVEISLRSVFSKLGFEVSFLYGGGQFGGADKELINETQIIIATPEKAKAIARSDRSIIRDIDLIIIDEGHLLGAESQRLVLNEVFLEELRAYYQSDKGKILLLSAVLPNVEDIAEWLTGDKDNSQSDSWRPSSEKFGLLTWNGQKVDIEWTTQDEDRGRRPFNSGFITPIKSWKPRRRRLYPSNKNEAIAATAIKLSQFGSVLIFVAQRSSVLSYASDVLLGMGKNPQFFQWNDKGVWGAFKLACGEAFGENSDWLKYAEYGILCHNGSLPAEVRLPLEKLMRNERPPIIISTSTLGQGVNIGVSSVIFSTVWQNQSLLTSRDFWNIAGRAGRAFTDIEGKILCAVDSTEPNWKVQKRVKEINNFFDKSNIETTKSGILTLLKQIKKNASEAGIPFDQLVELIANNNLGNDERITENIKSELQEFFGQVDDTLISLNIEFEANLSENTNHWVDDFFRGTLAGIQSSYDEEIDTEDIVYIFQARNQILLQDLGQDLNRWKRIVSMGLPLQSGVKLEDKLERILELTSDHRESEDPFLGLLVKLKGLEEILFDLPVIQRECGEIVNIDTIDDLRRGWLGGMPLNEVKALVDGGEKIINKYYSFTLPWVINAAAKLLKSRDLQEDAEMLEYLATCCELGLPNLLAAKIFLAGIRSRVAVVEIGALILDQGLETITEIRRYIFANAKDIKTQVSGNTSAWIDIFINESNSYQQNEKIIPQFFFTKRVPEELRGLDLYIRSVADKIYLSSDDCTERIDVSKDTLPFGALRNNLGVFFRFNETSERWEMHNMNPNQKFKS